jgi:predicted Rossmann-fold nucleotide-binding protein
MFKLMEYGDSFIIFKGGSGTMSEFGTAWVLAKIYYGHHRPFILFGEHWIPIIDTIRSNMNIDAKEYSVFEICRNTEEVLRTIQKFEMKIATRDHSKDGNGDVYDKAFTK